VGGANQKFSLPLNDSFFSRHCVIAKLTPPLLVKENLPVESILLFKVPAAKRMETVISIWEKKINTLFLVEEIVE
jgi:hypothetical protein